MPRSATVDMSQEVATVLFRDPEEGYDGREGCVRWTTFVNFLRDPQSGITVVGIGPNKAGQYKCHVRASDVPKIEEWMELNGVPHHALV